MQSTALPNPPNPRAGASSAAVDLTPTVFVVDGDLSVRESMEALVQGAGWEARTFASAATFLRCSPGAGPSCLVLDVGLPDISGLDVQARVARERTAMPVIFMTKYADIPMTVRAMKAGAVEFLVRPVRENVLLEAIAAAVERSRATVGTEADLQELRERHDTLSPRERQVMARVARGLLNKQVGGELGISEITVKAHRGRVMEKMRARSLAELVTLSGRLGLS